MCNLVDLDEVGSDTSVFCCPQSQSTERRLSNRHAIDVNTTNPNPNPNRNFNWRTENSPEQIQLSFCADENIIYAVFVYGMNCTFVKYRSSLGDFSYVP